MLALTFFKADSSGFDAVINRLVHVGSDVELIESLILTSRIYPVRHEYEK